MKYILITDRFRHQLGKLKKYLKEADIVNDVKRFILSGPGKGETYLQTYTVPAADTDVMKLRLCVRQVNFRYLLGIINEREYIPIIIDLKKGRYGKNLSFTADRKTVRAIETAVIHMIDDYLEHTEEHPTLTAYVFDEDAV